MTHDQILSRSRRHPTGIRSPNVPANNPRVIQWLMVHMSSFRVVLAGISPSVPYGGRNRPAWRSITWPGHSMRPRLGVRSSSAVRRPTGWCSIPQIPNRNYIRGLSDLLARPMARRACRPAIGRLQSPSTLDCVTPGPLGIPNHNMCSPFLPPTRTHMAAAGTYRRRHPLPHACLRMPARILPHSLKWLGRAHSLRVSTIHDFLRDSPYA